MKRSQTKQSGLRLDQVKLSEAVMKLTQGKGVDLIVDAVGGPLFEPCLESLAHKGRQVAIACVGDPRVGLTKWTIIGKKPT